VNQGNPLLMASAHLLHQTPPPPCSTRAACQQLRLSTASHQAYACSAITLWATLAAEAAEACQRLQPRTAPHQAHACSARTLCFPLFPWSHHQHLGGRHVCGRDALGGCNEQPPGLRHADVHDLTEVHRAVGGGSVGGKGRAQGS